MNSQEDVCSTTHTDCYEFFQPGVTDQTSHVLRRENCDSTAVQSHSSPYQFDIEICSRVVPNESNAVASIGPARIGTDGYGDASHLTTPRMRVKVWVFSRPRRSRFPTVPGDPPVLWAYSRSVSSHTARSAR